LSSFLVAILYLLNIVNTSGRAVEPCHASISLSGLTRAIRRDGR
jgi:hypothetical protein